MFVSLGVTRRRPIRAPRTDAEVLAHDEDMALLEAVRAGRVVRGDGNDSSILAPHLLDGRPVRLWLHRLAAEGLVNTPISGPPALAPRGERLIGGGRPAG